MTPKKGMMKPIHQAPTHCELRGSTMSGAHSVVIFTHTFRKNAQSAYPINGPHNVMTKLTASIRSILFFNWRKLTQQNSGLSRCRVCVNETYGQRPNKHPTKTVQKIANRYWPSITVKRCDNLTGRSIDWPNVAFVEFVISSAGLERAKF